MYSRDNKIMRKLLGKATPDNSTDTTSPSLGITSAPNPHPSYRPSSSQYAAYDAGYPIFSIDASADRRSAVLGSRHVLKTVVIDGLKITEGVDLRAAIVAASNPIKSAASSTVSDQLSVKDAKWCKDTAIFTACANGKIFSYDILRIASGGSPLDCVQMREDSRQVNTVDVNPHWASTLLSGSQDGFVRYFDIRGPVQNRAGGMTYKARAAFKCNADGVRHAKWSPKDGFQLACATEAGVVLKWDVRKPTTPLLRITAHEKACSSISWHPDGNHLISGGWDQKCAVWDLSNAADKRQKPKWVIHTPAPVSAVAWRPALWSASAQGRRAGQVAVSYDDASLKRFGIKATHIWDVARPTMPFKELDWFESPPSSLLWMDQDVLWTVGEEGKFHQCDVAFAPKVVDRLSSSSLAFSGRGDVAMFLDERPPGRPRPAVVHQQEITAVPRSTYGSSPTTPMLSISRSDSEDDVVGTFLGPRRRIGGARKRRASVRSIPALSTTPPSGPGSGEVAVLGLEQSIKFTGIYKTQQAMAVGRVPSAAKTSHYQYLSQCYLESLERELPCVHSGRPLVDRVGIILEHFARAAESVGQYRLAQTWRILGFSVDLLLKRRAQYHLEVRLSQSVKPGPLTKPKESTKLSSYRMLGVVAEELETEITRRPSAVSATVRSLLSEEIESTSNQTTPVAGPFREDDTSHSGHRSGKKLTPVVELDSFSLPPAASSTLNQSPRKRLDSAPLSTVSHESDGTQISSTEGYDFYDADAISHAIEVPGSQELVPQTIDCARDSQQRPLKAGRTDSDDSFAQMFPMSDTTRRAGAFSAASEAGPAGNGNADNRPVDTRKGRDEDQGEYESRIRGKELEQASQQHDHSALHMRQSARSESPEGVFMISQTTGTSCGTVTSEEPLKQSQSFASEDQSYDEHPAPLHVGIEPSGLAKTDSDPLRQLESTPTIIESDYLPWLDDPPYPHPLALDQGVNINTPPLDPCAVVSRALDFELRTSTLNASAIILLLKPLMPQNMIDSKRATSILRSYHRRLISMQLFVEAALLRNLCVKGWPEGLPDWGDNYSSMFGLAQQGVKGGLLCPSCRKPREVDPKKGPGALWQCEQCKAHMGPCAVCGHREASAVSLPVIEAMELKNPKNEQSMSVWWYCPGCAHGGHATCIQGWHGPGGLDKSGETDFEAGSAEWGSDGCCPLDGCGHACLPGKWRDERATSRADEVGRVAAEKARAGGPQRQSSSAAASPTITPMGSAMVRGDGVEVPQSRAVESVRETLGGESVWSSSGGVTGSRATGSATTGTGSGPGVGILSSSPGRSADKVDRERRKSVKFVSTER